MNQERSSSISIPSERISLTSTLNDSGTPPPAAAPKPEPVKEPKGPSKAGEFFKNILSRTKGLLIDDYDDKSY